MTRRVAGVGWWFESAVAANALPAHSMSAGPCGHVKVYGQGKGSATRVRRRVQWWANGAA
jgi:hypothetical protein